MIQISVKSDLERHVSQWARVAGDQMPFATAKALTESAKAAKEEIERQMPQILDRPSPYAMRGFRLIRAEKTRLVATVDFRGRFGSSVRDYLNAVVFGGTRKLKAFERSISSIGLLPAGYSAVPGSAARMDAYGNMAPGQIVQLLSYFKAFGPSGKGRRSNTTDERRAALARGTRSKAGMTYFVGRPGGGSLPLGIWQRTATSEGSDLKPIVIFVSKTSYRKQLDVPGIAERVLRRRFPDELRKAVAQALATRRPS